MACLEIVLGPGAGKVFDLDDVLLIGRHDCCDLVLKAGSVSRTHALITHSEDRYILRDLAASNGLFLQGSRVTSSQPLSDGDAIRVGSVFLMFHAEDTHALVTPVRPTATNAA